MSEVEARRLAQEQSKIPEIPGSTMVKAEVEALAHSIHKKVVEPFGSLELRQPR